MRAKSLLRGTAALICAAVLLSSGLNCRALDISFSAKVREALHDAMAHVGHSVVESISHTEETITAGRAEALEGSCIIGHSHAVGMQMTLQLPELAYIAEVGMTAASMLTHQEFNLPGGGKGSLRMGLEAREYERIYVLLGSNDILGGSSHLPVFHRDMEKFLQVLEEYQPQAEVYLLSIAPLGESFLQYCQYNYGLTQETMGDYNQSLCSLAQLYDLEFLDITTPLSDENGFLSRDFDRGDGLHFNADGNEMILNTLLGRMEINS